MQGLSIANNLLAGRVQYNLDKNQAALKNDVRQLSSGLRINSAADDPSGLAISTNLQTQVDAFQTAAQNVQNANNAAQVAEGALGAETEILQRIRDLAVEAASSINSTSDNANLQAEVTQLLLELNHISQSVNFNGQPLLDGTFAGFQPATSAYFNVTANSVLATNGNLASTGNVDYGYLLASVSAGSANFYTTPNSALPSVQGLTAVTLQDGNFLSTPMAANTMGGIDAPVPAGWTAFGNGVNLFNGTAGATPLPAGQQGVVLQQFGGGMSQTLTGLTPGAQYEITLEGQSWGGAAQLQVQANGTTVLNVTPPTSGFQSYTTAAFTAPASGNVTLSLSNPGGNDLSIANVQAVALGATVDGTIQVQVINTGASIAAQETFIDSSTGLACVSSTLLAPDSTATLFDNVSVTLGDFTASDVGTTGYIKVSQEVAASSSSSGPFTVQSGAGEGDTVQIGIQATNAQTLRISNINIANTSAPVLAAEDAIGQINIALQTLLDQRAQLGAIIVRLNEDANNDNVAAVNLQASESAIRDVNVGQATTDFTKLQVMVQIGTSILSQANANAQSVLGLFR